MHRGEGGAQLMIKRTSIHRHLARRRKRGRGGMTSGSKLALMLMATALARIRPVFHLRVWGKMARFGLQTRSSWCYLFLSIRFRSAWGAQVAL